MTSLQICIPAAVVLATYAGLAWRSFRRDTLQASAYPSPERAAHEVRELCMANPALCTLETIGASSEGRPIDAVLVRASRADPQSARRPRLLVTAHIHAVEFVGSFVARALLRHLVLCHASDPDATALLERADVWFVPLLNPDGAARVWRRNGWSGLGNARFTAGGVDPNRNFPFAPISGRRSWNSGRARPGSAYYRGPHPLSEPECAALVRLCERERFHGAVNFHSFGGVVFIPDPAPNSAPNLRRGLDIFRGEFQSRQRFCRYRPVLEHRSAIAGQLDLYLMEAFHCPSVTIEVSRPGWHLLRPSHLFNIFWWANPPDPQRWAENDVPAAVYALRLLAEA